MQSNLRDRSGLSPGPVRDSRVQSVSNDSRSASVGAKPRFS